MTGYLDLTGQSRDIGLRLRKQTILLYRQGLKGASFTEHALQIATRLVETRCQRGPNRIVFHNLGGQKTQLFAGVRSLTPSGFGVLDELMILVSLTFEGFCINSPLALQAANGHSDVLKQRLHIRRIIETAAFEGFRIVAEPARQLGQTFQIGGGRCRLFAGVQNLGGEALRLRLCGAQPAFKFR